MGKHSLAVVVEAMLMSGTDIGQIYALLLLEKLCFFSKNLRL